MTLTAIFLTILILSLAAGLRATFGFGDALFAMPLLAFVWNMQMVSPLVACLGLTVSMIVLWQDWRKIDIRVVWRLILAVSCGIPIGLLILTQIFPVIVAFFHWITLCHTVVLLPP